MLACLLLMLLLLPSLAYAQLSTQAQRTLEAMMCRDGRLCKLTMQGTSAPALSVAGQGVMYYDTATNTFQVSQNGGAYVTLAGAGGSAPANATYVVQTAHAGLSAEQVLADLATGYVKVTTGTGALSAQAVPVPVTDGGTGLTTTTANQLLYSTSANVVGGSANLTYDGTVFQVQGALGNYISKVTDGTATFSVFINNTSATGNQVNIGSQSNHSLSLIANDDIRVHITVLGNVGIGTYNGFGTSAQKVFSQAIGTAPTTSPADVVQEWVADWNGAGTAAKFWRVEEGTQHSFGSKVRLGGALEWTTDNSTDIGALAANRPANIYAAVAFGAAGNAGVTNTVTVCSSGACVTTCTLTFTGGILTTKGANCG